MKILTAEQVRQADQYTIQNEPISSLDLMERAATKCVDWLLDDNNSPLDYRFPLGITIKIFCGMGNNGGDGLVIARLLAEKGFPSIQVFMVNYADKYSPDCEENIKRLEKVIEKLEKKKNKSTNKATSATYEQMPAEQHLSLHYIKSVADFPTIEVGDVVIDAIFGSGLNKPIKDFTAQLITYLNNSSAHIIAIDIPSGLFAENNEDIENKAIVKAHQTLTFESHKLAFFYDQNYIFTGKVHLIYIGLDRSFIAQQASNLFLLTKKDIYEKLKIRPKTAHKGNFGHALLVAGSEGKMGAAVLSAKACMRSGVGLLTVHIPKCGYHIMQTAIPEAMVVVDKKKKSISKICQEPTDLEKYTAIGVGCGLGKGEKTVQAFYDLLKSAFMPMVIDADGLNILAENLSWWEFVPKHSILTPHPKEFERLFGRANNPYLRHQLQIAMSKQRQVFIILKGATTSITTPEGKTYFNTQGNAGMATGGSGDVLTGILTSLLAQGYTPEEACCIGTYLHGMAGDIAAKRLSQEAMIAGDIIKYLGRAFHSLHNNKG
jgi:NAD(P)H-hydrate epimerase